MKSIKSKFVRGLALLLALIFILNVPVSAFATTETTKAAEDEIMAVLDEDTALLASSGGQTYTSIAKMKASAAFQALKYLGYDRNGKLESSGNLFMLTGSKVDSQYRTDIGYTSVGTGLQTSSKNTGYTSVTSATGKYPNVSKFAETGLDCVDYAAYFLTNYMRNIEGADLDWLDDILASYSGYTYDNMYFWSEARTKLIKAGVDVYRVDSFNTSNVTSGGETLEVKEIAKYTVYNKKSTTGTSVNNSTADIYSKLEPGDLIQMGNSDSENVHYAIYAGTYNGKHYMYHCGNSRGPEINIIENMWTYETGSKKSVPLYFYHFENPEQYGKVSVKKDDPDGKPLAGAKFVLTLPDGSLADLITDKTGTAFMDELPLGDYTIQEVEAPQGYVLDSTVKSFTLTKDKATYTYSLTNKLATSSPRRKSIDFRPPRKRGGARGGCDLTSAGGYLGARHRKGLIDFDQILFEFFFTSLLVA